jgi:NAD(P)-dependent dehydrogenase (short-subunit alcohol dehydrogenase family)
LAFAQEGAAVAAADLSEDDNVETVRMIEDLGGQVLALRCDVTSSEDVKNALDTATAEFGPPTVAFNNAGIEQPITAAADLTQEEWDRILAINLSGVFTCMKHEIPLMLEQGGGVIVNTSSGAGVAGFAGQAAYSAAKHGVIGLTKTAALDYGPIGIRVNAVAPGPILTEGGIGAAPAEVREPVAQMLPLKRIGTPGEVAQVAAWLLSDAASFVNGVTISIDGGKLAGAA